MHGTLLRICLIVALCGTIALGSAGGASAAYAPKFVVSLDNGEVSQSAGITFDLSQPATDSRTARVAVYIPAGFSLVTSQSVGTSIGTVKLVLQSASGPVTVSGAVTTDNAATHALDACSPGTNLAVWLLTAGTGGSAVTIPIYVNRTSAAEAMLGDFKFVACLGANNVIGMVLATKNVFTNSSGGSFQYAFTSVFTPFGTNNQPDRAAAVSARGIVRLPVQIHVAARYVKKRGRAIITGQVVETSLQYSLPGAKVRLFSGRTPGSKKAVATSTANRKGQFTFAVKATGTTFYHVELVPSIRSAAGNDCPSEPSVAPSGCVSATVGFVPSRSDNKRVRVPARG